MCFLFHPIFSRSGPTLELLSPSKYLAPQYHMRQRRNVSHAFISLCLVLVPQAAYVAPEWWQKGWARRRVDSVAEAELLSQLAAILMPNLEVQELFRSFPSPDGWGGHALEPDLAAFGILKEKDAALFVEYDGFWMHQEKKGMVMDRRKNSALLTYAPKGSLVVRISHTKRKPLKENVLWVKVHTWRQGHGTSLLETLKNVLTQISTGLADVLHPCTMKQVRGKINQELWSLSESGWNFAKAAIDQIHGSSSEELISFLRAEGFSAQSIEAMTLRTWFCGQSIEGSLKPKFRWIVDLGLTKSQVAKAVATHPQILGLRIEQNLKPTVQWLLDLGLTKSQVAKAVASHPRILGFSVQQNLKPTVQWLLHFGLTKIQVAKAVATHSPILGYSIEQNLKPTAQWLLDLGLTKSQVAKAVATHPQILGLSIEQNLKPTVQWLLDLGLTKSQVAKAVASYPHILGYSVQQNLKPTVEWLLDLGLTTRQVAKAVASYPRILGYSVQQNLKPTVQWLLHFGLTKIQVAKAVASCPQILGYSVQQKLKPTAQWLLDLGLTKSQVAKAVAAFPQILSFSVRTNLNSKIRWLLEVGLNKTQVAKAVASSPQMLGLSLENNMKKKHKLMQSFLARKAVAQQIATFSPILHYRYKRLEERLIILALCNQTSKLAGAMTLTDEKFKKRYMT